MKTVTFTYLGAECEYNFETRNLHIISKHSFNSPNKTNNHTLSKEHNIRKKDIKSITFKYNNTQLPAYIYYYFANFINLESIELKKLDFKNIKTINGFITNCPKMKEIDISHKNAENITSISYFIGQTQNTKSITIKDINAPNLKEIEWLLWNIKKDIKEISIENITAPNIDFINHLINTSNIKTLDLTKIGNVNVYEIETLIAYCDRLETLKLNPITNTKEIGIFILESPVLKTKVLNKINKIKILNPHFLQKTIKNEPLDLNKFEDITSLASHLNLTSKYPENQQYPSIKIGRYKIKFSEYSIILENNILIADKTEEEIIKELITQSKNETKENIESFLEKIKDTKIFKNKECEKQLKSKLTIIKNLK